jgi:16S rRNA processing protein RimM
VSAKTQKWVTLGRVSGVFGVKGWLKVRSYTEPHSNVLTFRAWTLRLEGADRAVDVEDGQDHAGAIVAKLRGVDDRDSARSVVGADIVVERERLPPLETDEFYWADLEGCEVRTTAGLALGCVESMLATGAHDMLVLPGKPERLIPFVAGRIVKHVDLAERVIVVDWSPDYWV